MLLGHRKREREIEREAERDRETEEVWANTDVKPCVSWTGIGSPKGACLLNSGFHLSVSLSLGFYCSIDRKATFIRALCGNVAQKWHSGQKVRICK